jgi:hypothetical protein
VHLLRETTNGYNAAIAPIFGDYTGFIYDDFVFIIDDGVGCTEINRDLLHEKIEQSHDWTWLSVEEQL